MTKFAVRPAYLSGGGFLLGSTNPDSVFTPEDRSAEERRLVAIADKFIDSEVLPEMEALERQEPGLARKLFARAGALGLLKIEIPEDFGGLGFGKRTAMGIGEKLARGGGFGLTCSVHSGVGSAGVCYFGTSEQKRKYLPKLASGAWMAAYCLSEAASGSDALGMKTKAVLSADGKHFILNGTKRWITNSGWADLFTIFAKVDGEKTTAFLVERTFRGLLLGKEEHKLGLKSSSTCRVILEDVRVPVENVLGEVGKGAYIAFNVLNFGRLNFGVSGIGLAQEQLRVGCKYAGERQQFGKPIAAFGLIQKKLADMAVKVFATESAAHRTAGLIDELMATGEVANSIAPGFPLAMEEFALECSVVKTRGAEAASEVADESLQIHGGCGYTEDFSPARALRDARLNRIGEGTNEINRLFVPALLMRRSDRGRFPLREAISQAMLGLPFPAAADDDFQKASAFLANAKRLAFYLCGVAGDKFWEKKDEDQEVLAAISDVIADIYLAESAVLRALKTRDRNGVDSIQSDLALLFVSEAVQRMEVAAALVLAASSTVAAYRSHQEAVRGLLAWEPLNPVVRRQRVARHLGQQGEL